MDTYLSCEGVHRPGSARQDVDETLLVKLLLSHVRPRAAQEQAGPGSGQIKSKAVIRRQSEPESHHQAQHYPSSTSELYRASSQIGC